MADQPHLRIITELPAPIMPWLQIPYEDGKGEQTPFWNISTHFCNLTSLTQDTLPSLKFAQEVSCMHKSPAMYLNP